MSENTFRFKQFSIAQDKCAMKVNTDGVLLGAWADVKGAKSILDIGTGTGVIALMAAQRNSEATIDAIDIDESAYTQAKENFGQCKWEARLKIFHSSLQEFPSEKQYDVIISNPPYFIDDFKTGNEQKNIAKHSVALTYKELMEGINRLVIDSGKVFIAVPVFNFPLIEMEANRNRLFVTKHTEVVAVEGKSPYLLLMQIERNEKQFSKDSITIQKVDGNFTGEYKSLTKEFYLKF